MRSAVSRAPPGPIRSRKKLGGPLLKNFPPSRRMMVSRAADSTNSRPLPLAATRPNTRYGRGGESVATTAPVAVARTTARLPAEPVSVM